MPTLRGQSLAPRLDRLESQFRESLRQKPAGLEMTAGRPHLMSAAGMPPDPRQERVHSTSAAQMLLLCGRQIGKLSVSVAVALSAALLKPRSPVVLLSPSDRQSAELFRKVVSLYDAAGPCPPTPTLHGDWS